MKILHNLFSRRVFLAFLIVVLSFMSFNNINNTQKTLSRDTGTVITPDVTAYYKQGNGTILDGNISSGEYPMQYNLTDMQLSLFHNGSDLFVGLSANTTGWVAIGFNSQGVGMTGADIKIGSVVSGVPNAEDAYTTGHKAPIQDAEQNILYNLSEINGKTTFEFEIPLNSSDINDLNMTIGGYYAIFTAYSSSDSYSTMHTSHSNILTLFISPDTSTSSSASTSSQTSTQSTKTTSTSATTTTSSTQSSKSVSSTTSGSSSSNTGSQTLDSSNTQPQASQTSTSSKSKSTDSFTFPILVLSLLVSTFLVSLSRRKR